MEFESDLFCWVADGDPDALRTVEERHAWHVLRAVTDPTLIPPLIVDMAHAQLLGYGWRSCAEVEWLDLMNPEWVLWHEFLRRLMRGRARRMLRDFGTRTQLYDYQIDRALQLRGLKQESAASQQLHLMQRAGLPLYQAHPTSSESRIITDCGKYGLSLFCFKEGGFEMLPCSPSHVWAAVNHTRFVGLSARLSNEASVAASAFMSTCIDLFIKEQCTLAHNTFMAVHEHARIACGAASVKK